MQRHGANSNDHALWDNMDIKERCCCADLLNHACQPAEIPSEWESPEIRLQCSDGTFH